MTAFPNSSASQETEKKNILSRLSRRNKIIGAGLLVLLALFVISIPGDQSQLLVRQERVETAQAAYDLAFPAVEPMMESVRTYIEETGLDLASNRTYTGLSTAMTTFGRANTTPATRFQAVVTFSTNVHTLLDGNNAIAELDTDEFRTLVADMDTTLSLALLALMELNEATDEYNGYQSWLSAKAASAIFGLPNGYPDPVPTSSRLNASSLNR